MRFEPARLFATSFSSSPGHASSSSESEPSHYVSLTLFPTEPGLGVFLCCWSSVCYMTSLKRATASKQGRAEKRNKQSFQVFISYLDGDCCCASPRGKTRNGSPRNKVVILESGQMIRKVSCPFDLCGTGPA